LAQILQCITQQGIEAAEVKQALHYLYSIVYSCSIVCIIYYYFNKRWAIKHGGKPICHIKLLLVFYFLLN